MQHSSCLIKRRWENSARLQGSGQRLNRIGDAKSSLFDRQHVQERYFMGES